jgi:nucleotide-binding universal stress UspA family protein
MTDFRLSGSVVVGVDGSPDSLRALEWGREQARLEGRPLVVLHVADPWSRTRVADADRRLRARVLRRLQRPGADITRDAEARVRRASPELDIRSILTGGDIRTVLLEASTQTAMLVLGARGHGPVPRLLLGSVASTVSRHASCPVVVVRRRPEPPHNAVLVGTDGTENSDPALDFAFRVAESRSLPLTVTHCFWEATGRTGATEVDQREAERRRRMVLERLDQRRHRHPRVDVTVTLVRGFADQHLVTATRLHELVVLGHRQLPLVQTIIHGTVTPLVVEHAAGNVAVVPAATPPRRGSRAQH